jgi:hypothetical protein
VSSVRLYQARPTLLECLCMHLGVTPIQTFAALLHREIRVPSQAKGRCVEISFERISRVNAIVIDRHDQCISAASRQLLLNRLTSSEITEKVKRMCRIHDARPAIAKRRNTK